MADRISDKGFQSMKGSQSAVGSDPETKAEIDAILARLDTGQDDGPTTITLGDEDWAADYYDAEEESVDDLSAFLAGEPIGTAYDPFSETDPALYEQSVQDQLAFQRNEEANRIVEAESRPGSGHQALKNWLHTLLPSDTTLSVEDMIVPVGVGGEADVKGALRINIFPRVGQEDHEHSYYNEAMLYQEDQARETLRTPKPAMDLGGTEGVDFATRLRESFLNR
tara:strand:- start:2264 stop:2935 length:672 start_codon:yes stop_codon:yes gene_type:complete